MADMKCECGNRATSGTQCEWCEQVAGQPPHTGHFSRIGGGWWCDTCNSPYCDLA
jgi:hypothetical protein